MTVVVFRPTEIPESNPRHFPIKSQIFVGPLENIIYVELYNL